MRTDFAMIENYKKMLKSLEEPIDESPEPATCDDQEVPNSQIPLTSVVKMEQPCEQDFCSLADMFVSNFGYNSNMVADSHNSFNDLNGSSYHIPQSEHFLSNPKDLSQSAVATSAISTTEMCPSVPSNISTIVSSQSVQIIPQSQTSSFSYMSSPSSVKMAMSSKTKTYVTGLAGSGCTVTTNSSNFLSNSNPDCLQDQFQEETLEYTDLDKQVSFYDDIDTAKAPMLSCTRRPVPVLGGNESETLEDAIQFMQEIIQQDSNDLNIPFDPHSWTCEHVCHWVDWVCHKNEVLSISKHLSAVSGQALCSWNQNNFSSQFGPTGNYLFHELELWKAASSCYHQQSKQALGPISCQSVSVPQNNCLRERDTFVLTPASSPALSSSGESSTSSSNDVLSQQSDMTDEENVFYPDVKASSKDSTNKLYKRVPGRGHKKSPALWQFLRKLLLSEQNYGCIRWIDRKAGIFKIEDSKRVASLWGAEKNRPAMNYDKLSRSVRQYYKKGIIKKPEQSKRLLYQFCPEYL